MTGVRRRLGLRGAGIAVTFSLLGHAGVALFAAHRSHTETVLAAQLESALATSEADFVTTDDADAPVSEAPRTVSTVAAASRAPRAPAAHASVATTTNTTSRADAQPAASLPTVSQDSSGPHFAMTVAAVSGGTANVATAALAGASAGPSSGAGLGPIAAASADIPAKLRSGSVPAYTAAALAASVEANVPLEIVVNESGIVVSARVLERVGYGLDEAARQGMLAYRFTPAVRGGKPVAVRMQWLMRFQLR